MTVAGQSDFVTVTDLMAAVRRQQCEPSTTPEPSHVSTDLISVIGAHPGSGATAVSVATVDALASLGHEVTLLDIADAPDAFGCAERAVGSSVTGSRVGRRGRVTIVRPESKALDASLVSPLTVVDGRHQPARLVVVCRPTLPSMGKAGQLLDDRALLAVVGASRLPRLVVGSLSPAAARAFAGGRVVFFPHHRETAILGPSPEPSSHGALTAATRLASLIWPDLVQPAHRLRRKVGRR